MRISVDAFTGSLVRRIRARRGIADVVHCFTRRDCIGPCLLRCLFPSIYIGLQILWYNKSRSQSRVCPACQRLYRLGDILADLIDEGEGNNGDEKPISPFLVREQHLSGLCSPMCFILASFNYPGAIRSAWGRMAEEMDDEAWGHLNGPGAGTVPSAGQTLGMLVRMTRLDDLGLGQLCFGE